MRWMPGGLRDTSAAARTGSGRASDAYLAHFNDTPPSDDVIAGNVKHESESSPTRLTMQDELMAERRCLFGATPFTGSTARSTSALRGSLDEACTAMSWRLSEPPRGWAQVAAQTVSSMAASLGVPPPVPWHGRNFVLTAMVSCPARVL